MGLFTSLGLLFSNCNSCIHLVLGHLRHLGTLFLQGPQGLVPPRLESFLQPWGGGGGGRRRAEGRRPARSTLHGAWALGRDRTHRLRPAEMADLLAGDVGLLPPGISTTSRGGGDDGILCRRLSSSSHSSPSPSSSARPVIAPTIGAGLRIAAPGAAGSRREGPPRCRGTTRRCRSHSCLRRRRASTCAPPPGSAH